MSDSAALVGTLVVPAAAATEPAPESPPPMWRATEQGCCPLPFWSADSKRVLFWYAPPDGPPGVYGVPVEGAPPTFAGGRPAAVFAGGAFTSTRIGDTTELWRVADGRRWSFDLGPDGWLALAPDGRHAATVSQIGRFIPGNTPPPVRHGLVDLETGATQDIRPPERYTLSGWTADGVWLMALTTGDADQPSLIRFDPVGQAEVPGGGESQSPTAAPATPSQPTSPATPTPTASPATPAASPPGAATPTPVGLTVAADAAGALLGRLRSARLSPGGKWIAYLRAFDPKPENNGIFVVPTRFNAPPRRIGDTLTGGFRWRDADRLLVVPQTPGHASMALWQVDAATGETALLVDPRHPGARPLRIAGAEWSVSPDGHHVAYRHASDDTIWVILLP